MNVRPTSTPGAAPVDAGALRRTTPAAPTRHEAAVGPVADRSGQDAVELSAEALALHAGGDAPRASELPPERLRTVLERIGSNFYDQPAVRDRILERLASDLENAG